MALDDPDWFREHPPHRPEPRSRSTVWLLALAGAIAVVALASPPGQRLLGLQSDSAGAAGATITAAPSGTATDTDGVVIYSESPSPAGTSLYPPHDQWQRFLAGESVCPGGQRTDLPPAQQMQTMLCLINWARERAGLNELPESALLAATSREKADEIVRCREFAHAACGSAPDTDIRATGYPGSFGENLYIAGGAQGAPRVALDGWLNSPGHRDNLFRPEWRAQGIALVKLAHFGPYDDMSLWVSHFDSG